VIAALTLAVFQYWGTSQYGTAVAGSSPLAGRPATGGPATEQNPGSMQTRWGPLSSADRDLLVMVRLAGMSGGASGQQAQQQGASAQVRTVARHIWADYGDLDSQVRSIPGKLGVPLRDQPPAQQQGGMRALSGRSELLIRFPGAALRRTRLGPVHDHLVPVHAANVDTGGRDQHACRGVVIGHDGKMIAERAAPFPLFYAAMPILKREADAFPDSIFDLHAPWWVAHLRSRQEKLLARYLREHRIPFYLPQMEKRIRRSGRTFVSYLPLFSGYVFIRGGREERLQAVRGNVLVSVREPPDQAEISAELQQLRQLQLTDMPLVPQPFVGRGDSVLITDGAFQGYRGVVLKEKGITRLIVSVSFIRQSVALEIDREFIRPQRT